MTETASRGSFGEAPDWGRRMGIKHLWSEIVPGLYMGGTADDDTVDHGRRIGLGFGGAGLTQPAAIGPEQFDAVVTLYAWARPVDWLVEELRWGIYDSPEGALDLEGIRETVEWTHRRWKAGKKVLVRCQAGLNRSGLITALVLIREGYSAVEAVNLIRNQRCGECLFNKSFLRLIVSHDPGYWRQGMSGLRSRLAASSN